MKNPFFVFLVLLFMSPGLLLAQELDSDQIDLIVNTAMTRMPHAGLAVAVVKNNEVMHLKGYGVTSVNSKEKVDENTLFAIASNSKAFTSFALFNLDENGKGISISMKGISPNIDFSFDFQDLDLKRIQE